MNPPAEATAAVADGAAPPAAAAAAAATGTQADKLAAAARSLSATFGQDAAADTAAAPPRPAESTRSSEHPAFARRAGATKRGPATGADQLPARSSEAPGADPVPLAPEPAGSPVLPLAHAVHALAGQSIIAATEIGGGAGTSPHVAASGVPPSASAASAELVTPATPPTVAINLTVAVTAEGGNGAGAASHPLAPGLSAPALDPPPAARASPALTPATVPGTTAPSSPARQLAAPLIALGAGTDGGQRLTVRLSPETLGNVEIQLDRPREGAASVAITVERPETLTLLLRDATQLQQALNQAGIPAEGRSLVFHIAPVNAGSHQDSASSGWGLDGGGAQAGGGGSREGGGRHETGGGPRSQTSNSRTPTGHWLRVGLDITA